MGVIAYVRGFGKEAPSDDRIFLRGTGGYNKAVKSLKFNETAALDMLKNVLKGKERAYFDATPLLLVNRSYLFGVPEKTSTRLEGYYVDGDTGRVIFRTSLMKVTDEERLPSNAYTSEVEIR